MGTRTRTTFAKRQKEQARQAKQQAKTERKQQRKLEKRNGGVESEFEETTTAEESEPVSSSGMAEPEAAAAQRDI